MLAAGQPHVRVFSAMRSDTAKVGLDHAAHCLDTGNALAVSLKQMSHRLWTPLLGRYNNHRVRTNKAFLDSLFFIRMPLHWQVCPCLDILVVIEPVTDAVTAMFDSSSKKRDREAGLMSHMCSLTGILPAGYHRRRRHRIKSFNSVQQQT